MSDEKKLWTYGEAKAKIREDVDLDEEDPDEQFVTAREFIGYFNEGIDEAEAEIHKINEDYFLTFDYVPLVVGQADYDLPLNIYAQKIRGIMYVNGPIIYRVRKFRMYNKFESVEFAQIYAASDDYRYLLTNTRPGGVKMTLYPPSRETAILPPLPGQFTPMKRWYLRNANRVPYPGDYTNPEYILPGAVNPTSNEITVAPLVPYVTGDQVKFAPATGATLPSPLVAGTVYYVIRVSDTQIKLATSKANATLGTAIDITTAGAGYFILRVAATDAIIDATIIDIPEFASFIMEWVKANCLYKDGDPRLSGTVAKLEQQRAQMVNTLTEKEPDNDDTIQGDFSSYTEMS